MAPWPTVNAAGNIQAVCDDRDTDTGNSTWTAYLNTFATLSNTKFYSLPSINSGTTETQNYEAAAWLVQQMFALDPYNPANYATVADIHLAIWSNFSTAALSSLASNSDAQSWHTMGLAHDSDPIANFADIVIYTPYQRFPGIHDGHARTCQHDVIGTGLLLIGAAIRRGRAR